MALHRRIAARAAIATVAAGVAVGLAGGPAQAATGTILIVSPSGPATALRNPPAGCHSVGTVPAPDSVVHNETNSQIIVYSNRSCFGTSWIVQPGGSIAFAPLSIRVVS